MMQTLPWQISNELETYDALGLQGDGQHMHPPLVSPAVVGLSGGRVRCKDGRINLRTQHGVTGHARSERGLSARHEVLLRSPSSEAKELDS